MPNWTDEEVVFYQEDGGTDRIKMIYDTLKEIYYPSQTVDYVCNDGETMKIASGWEASLNKWKKDYPKSNFDPKIISDSWICNMLPAFDLHHWYENGGESTTTRAFVDNLDESGIYSELEPGLHPHIRIRLHTAWSVVVKIWDELSEKYDLQYVQMGIEEGGAFAFNNDQENKYIKERYVIRYLDEAGDFLDERWIANLEGFTAMVKDCLEIENPLNILLPNAPGIISGNLARSKFGIEGLKRQLTVEKAVEAMNCYLKDQAEKGSHSEECFEYQMLSYE